MKTLTVSFFVAILLTTSTLFAANANSESTKSKNELISAIEKIVDYPEKGIDMAKSGFVTTTFKVEKDGSIKVAKVNGEASLKNHVKEQIESISLKDSNFYDKYFEIKIYFDFQEKF